MRMETLRQRMLELRRVSSLPYWRTSYADFLLDRAGEYLAVGREPEAEGVLDRIDHWLFQQESVLRKKHEASHGQVKTHIQLWKSDDLTRETERVRANLAARRALIPNTERDALSSRLDRIERHTTAGHLDEARSELNGVRAAMVRRLTRSYRAWSVAKQQSGPSAFPSTSGTTWTALAPSGPYNSRRNLDELLALVGERDPIWVEDFIEVYNDVLQYTERLSDPDKKKRK